MTSRETIDARLTTALNHIDAAARLIDSLRIDAHRLRRDMRPSAVERIINAAAAECQVSVAEVLSRRRTQVATKPRFIACLIAHQTTGLSLPAIGRAIGRDHTSVLHAIRKAEARVASDPDWLATYNATMRLLGRERMAG